MKTTIDLPEGLLRRAERCAAERGAVPPFQLHAVKGTLVQPGLDLDRTSALSVLDDELGFAEH